MTDEGDGVVGLGWKPAMQRACSCGSGESRWPEYDGYGIFLCYVCDECRAERMSRYRSDIKEKYFDPFYAGESLEPDEDY